MKSVRSHYHSLADAELASLLATDGERVFRYIYERYWDRLYVMARNRLGDPVEAEETVQDIFCNLWKKRDGLVLKKGFDNYFAVAVKFEVINRLAKRSRATAFEQEQAQGLPADQDLLQQLDYHELEQQFRLAVLALPEKCRIVFQLQHEQGYSLQEIARELDISPKTVESHLTKARKMLRAVFGNYPGLVL